MEVWICYPTFPANTASLPATLLQYKYVYIFIWSKKSYKVFLFCSSLPWSMPFGHVQNMPKQMIFHKGHMFLLCVLYIFFLVWAPIKRVKFVGNSRADRLFPWLWGVRSFFTLWKEEIKHSVGFPTEMVQCKNAVVWHALLLFSYSVGAFYSRV